MKELFNEYPIIMTILVYLGAWQLGKIFGDIAYLIFKRK